MRHGSLFSGIGGFDLAAEWVGWENIFHCEKDPFCRTVLHHYWPQSECYEDIRKFNAAKYRGLVGIISGGFPCQPFSNAGKRKGIKDDRYLWPETRRIITEIRPEWIVLENVAGLFTILEQQSVSEMEIKAVELFCKDKTLPPSETIIKLQRRVIGTIVQEIRSAGYVLPQLEDGTPVILCIPACAVNAPHRRDRVWFVAHAEHGTDRPPQGYQGRDISRTQQDGREKAPKIHQGRYTCPPGHKGIDTDRDSNGLHGGHGQHEVLPGETGQYTQHDAFPLVNGWSEWPTQSPVCSRNDGFSNRLAGIAFPKWREESIKGFGNAIVPQVAFELFKMIEQIK